MVWKELIFCCIVWKTTGYTCSLACNAPVGTSKHVIFPFPSTVKKKTKQKPSHTDTVCVRLQPTPHLYKSGPHWPLAGSLGQYALRCETGKHIVPFLCAVQPRGVSLACINIFTLNWIDGDQASVIWMRSEWHLKMEYPESWWKISDQRTVNGKSNLKSNVKGLQAVYGDSVP